MSLNKYTFVAICPICGKSRRVSNLKDGRNVECYNCYNHFLAVNPRKRKKRDVS